METTLLLTFLKESGKKHTLRIADAKSVQETEKVKALMDHIVSNNIIFVQNDPIMAVAEAKLQNLSESEVELV